MYGQDILFWISKYAFETPQKWPSLALKDKILHQVNIVNFLCQNDDQDWPDSYFEAGHLQPLCWFQLICISKNYQWSQVMGINVAM